MYGTSQNMYVTTTIQCKQETTMIDATTSRDAFLAASHARQYHSAMAMLAHTVGIDLADVTYDEARQAHEHEQFMVNCLSTMVSHYTKRNKPVPSQLAAALSARMQALNYWQAQHIALASK
jgi:hypothetical protein